MPKPQSRKGRVNLPVPVEAIGNRISLIRDQKVMLDSDLAELYQVATKSLNLAVRRNLDRFPDDFMFQLTKEDLGVLRFQSATSNGRGGRRYLPYVFTEQGVAMLSSVLKSKRAIQINIAIMRAFVQLRQVLATHKDVVRKLLEFDHVQKNHGAHIGEIWKTVRQLMEPRKKKKRYRIGFGAE